MNEIKVAIEGVGANEAAHSLLQIDGISGEVEAEAGAMRDGGLTAVATIVAIAGGAVAIAEQIRQWYTAYRAQQAVQRIEKVLIVTPNGRFLLEDASIAARRSELFGCAIATDCASALAG
ncbi:MAG: hypothetical protein WBD47_22720 [Phormidesmis sp.]